MPLVRISLIKGKTAAHARAIADGVQQALVETYNVPPDDRFQIIEQLERDALIYDPDYVGVHRTDDIVIVHIVAGRWRDTATKKALYARLVCLLAEKPGLRPEDLQIIISSNDRDDWSCGKGRATYVEDKAE